MTDARFEDGAEHPLRLIAQDAEGLGILAALLQDAVFPITEMRFAKTRRRFALLLNRFRWEDRAAAVEAGGGVAGGLVLALLLLVPAPAEPIQAAGEGP